ncbi:CsbD family protein [Sphingomonas sp. VNH70]|uniref:CsbD family protein n=1 Tax=Sphingomonas silueang TaxID=3156617 RepID=UPI0032B5A667
MNKDEFAGGVRYATGKVEKAVGDTVDSRDWQVDGVVDQVAGGARHSYGRARSILNDAIDSAPELAKEARERLHDVTARAADGARKGGHKAQEKVRDTPLLWVAAAAIGGYALAWAFHGRRG